MHLPTPGQVSIPPGAAYSRVALSSSFGLAEDDAERFAEVVGASGTLHLSTNEGAPTGMNFSSYRGTLGVHIHGKSVADEPWIHYRLELSTEGSDQPVDEDWTKVWPQVVTVLAEHRAVLRFALRAKRERVTSIVQPLALPSFQGFSHMAGCRLVKTQEDKPNGDELYSLLIDHSRDTIHIIGRMAVEVGLRDSVFEKPWSLMTAVLHEVVEFG